MNGIGIFIDDVGYVHTVHPRSGLCPKIPVRTGLLQALATHPYRCRRCRLPYSPVLSGTGQCGYRYQRFVLHNQDGYVKSTIHGA